jgi:hypothetical protein
MTVREYINQVINYIQTHKIVGHSHQIIDDSLQIDNYDVYIMSESPQSSVYTLVMNIVIVVCDIDMQSSHITYTNEFKRVIDLIDIDTCEMIDFIKAGCMYNYMAQQFYEINETMNLLQKSMDFLTDCKFIKNLNDITESYTQFVSDWEKIKKQIPYLPNE